MVIYRCGYIDIYSTLIIVMFRYIIIIIYEVPTAIPADAAVHTKCRNCTGRVLVPRVFFF